MKKKNSFTIIELLIAISIFAILVAIVLISYNDVTERAKEAKGMKLYQNINNTMLDVAGSWHLDEEEGIYAKDSSGNKADGQLWGGSNYCSNPPTEGCPTWVEGKVRGGLLFDGIDDKIIFYDKPSFSDTEETTIQAWININSKTLISGYAGIITLRTTTWATESYLSLLTNNVASPGLALYINGLQRVLNSNFSPTLNKWYHVVGTWKSGDKMKIYINGELVKSSATTYSGKASIGGTPIKHIGRLTRPDSFFSGIIDEVAVFRNALTANQIKKLYAQGLAKHLAEK
jgi:type II secretory pathway pseudopilin PulG